MRKIVPLLLVLLAILHQDYWWWNSVDPLVFGFVPIGLAYHAGVSVVAACLWALAVKYCWPKDVDVSETIGDAATLPSSFREGNR